MRLKSSSTCRRCRTWLEAGWSQGDDDERAVIEHQIAAGECFACQRKRQEIAVRYIHAADAIRMLQQVALACGDEPYIWIDNAQLLAVSNASAALTAAGMRDVRTTWDRRRRSEP